MSGCTRALLRGRDRSRRRRTGHVGDRTRLRLDRGHLLPNVTRDVARPQEPEDHGDDGADRGDHPADDEPEEESRHPDRGRDRPQARAGDVRVSWLVSLTARLALDSIALRSRVSTMCRLSRRDDSALCAGRVSRQVADAVLRPTGRYPLVDIRTHHDLLRPGARVLLGALVRRVDAELAAVKNCRPSAWSRWSSGPSVMRMSRFGSTFAVTRKNTSA